MARDGELHCCEYAIVDNEAIVDLGEHARFHVCRVFVVAWRGLGLLWKGALILVSAVTCCGCSHLSAQPEASSKHSSRWRA